MKFSSNKYINEILKRSISKLASYTRRSYSAEVILFRFSSSDFRFVNLCWLIDTDVRLFSSLVCDKIGTQAQYIQAGGK